MHLVQFLGIKVHIAINDTWALNLGFPMLMIIIDIYTKDNFFFFSFHLLISTTFSNTNWTHKAIQYNLNDY